MHTSNLPYSEVGCLPNIIFNICSLYFPLKLHIHLELKVLQSISFIEISILLVSRTFMKVNIYGWHCVVAGKVLIGESGIPYGY